jgi:hypothetical protein
MRGWKMRKEFYTAKRIVGLLLFVNLVFICSGIFEPLSLYARESRPMGTVSGTVRGEAYYVRGARIYKYVENQGWVHVATTFGFLMKKGDYQFKTEAGTYDLKAVWDGREDIRKNVKVEPDPVITVVDFVIPPKAK